MSYYDAFKSLGHTVELFDTKTAIINFSKPAKIGYQIHRFFPVEAWIRKANKQLAEYVSEFKPDMVIAFTGAEILPGTFAYIKTLHETKIVWYWADPLPNLTRYIHDSLPLADLVATYSKASMGVFIQMGAKETCWIPFAADLAAHHSEAFGSFVYEYDISFVGTWRPEREKVLQFIHEKFPELRLYIQGPYWNRCTCKPLKKYIVPKPVYGKGFTSIVNKSFLNLNVIDNTNYPSVNMRFYEIFAAGGAQIASASPEMADMFRDKQHLLYFSNEGDLIEKIKYAFSNKELIEKMKQDGQKELYDKHLYKNRATDILKALEKY